MVKFKKNGSSYGEMGIGYASRGLPAGHVKGRLQVRNRLLPQSTCQYLTDHNKNITGLADAQGKVVATWDYDAFGNIIQQTGTLAKRNPLRFSSEYHDEDLGLIYYNYRHYNPKDGRWISRDIASNGGDNIYSFVKNSIQSTDTLGLMMITSECPDMSIKDLLKEGCNRARQTKKKKLNQLVSASNPNKPDCSFCEKITLIIEVSDPCKGLVTYGHVGMGIGDDFKDAGLGEWGVLSPHWSGHIPQLSSLDTRIGTLAENPTVKVEFCVCNQRAKIIRDAWKRLEEIEKLKKIWSPIGFNCATAVTGSLGIPKNEFIKTPDDVLDDAENMVNECGSQRGKGAYFEIMKDSGKW